MMAEDGKDSIGWSHVMSNDVKLQLSVISNHHNQNANQILIDVH